MLQRLRSATLVALGLLLAAPTLHAQTPLLTGVPNTWGIVQLKDGRILVASSDLGELIAFNADGTGRATFATGLTRGGLYGGLAQLNDGRILVAEFFRGTVTAFDADGSNRTTFADELAQPVAITQLADGRVLIAEFSEHSNWNGKVTAFNADGSNRTTFADGFELPEDVIQLADSRILVAERNGSKVTAFNADGTGRATFADGFDRPRGLIELASGEILVAEFPGAKVTRLSPDGERQGVIGDPTGMNGVPEVAPTKANHRTEIASIRTPADILQLADGRLLVAEAYNGRVLSFPPRMRLIGHLSGFAPDYQLNEGEKTCSPNGVYCFTMQTDGNVVLYKEGNQFVWGLHNQLGVSVGPGRSLTLRKGNLMLYGGGGIIWQSHTGGGEHHYAAFLEVTNGGTVQIVTGTGEVLWSVPS